MIKVKKRIVNKGNQSNANHLSDDEESYSVVFGVVERREAPVMNSVSGCDGEEGESERASKTIANQKLFVILHQQPESRTEHQSYSFGGKNIHIFQVERIIYVLLVFGEECLWRNYFWERWLATGDG